MIFVNSLFYYSIKKRVNYLIDIEVQEGLKDIRCITQNARCLFLYYKISIDLISFHHLFLCYFDRHTSLLLLAHFLTHIDKLFWARGILRKKYFRNNSFYLR